MIDVTNTLVLSNDNPFASALRMNSREAAAPASEGEGLVRCVWKFHGSIGLSWSRFGWIGYICIMYI